jgi:predicted GNAT family acetyltransferase
VSLINSAAARGPASSGTSGTLRVLGGTDAPALLRLCERDPVANLFVSARLLSLAARSGTDLGGQVWGWFEDGELVSACWAGANLVPVEATPAALDAFAARARTEGRRCSSLVGPAEAVLALWQRLEPHWRGVREVRAHQPLMVCDTEPSVAPDPAVRRATPRELDLVVPACVAMFTEEIGYAPAPPDGGGAYRARIAELVAAGRSFVRVDAGRSGPEVVFKAELGAVSPQVVQVQGVWVPPHRRGEGLSEPGMAAVVQAARADGVTSVSLYVNDYNARALAAYRRVGFREVGSFATVLF